MKCVFLGCKRPVVYECRKLWGKGGIDYACEAHKPDASTRPPALRHLPEFFEVKPIRANA